MQSTGDPITDLMENMAAEQKARTTYDNILRLVKDDPDVYDAIKFLRAREIVHFQRFGESLRIVQDNLNSKNFYAFNPAFDNKKLLFTILFFINKLHFLQKNVSNFFFVRLSSFFIHNLFTNFQYHKTIKNNNRFLIDFFHTFLSFETGFMSVSFLSISLD